MVWTLPNHKQPSSSSSFFMGSLAQDSCIPSAPHAFPRTHLQRRVKRNKHFVGFLVFWPSLGLLFVYLLIPWHTTEHCRTKCCLGLVTRLLSDMLLEAGQGTTSSWLVSRLLVTLPSRTTERKAPVENHNGNK